VGRVGDDRVCHAGRRPAKDEAILSDFGLEFVAFAQEGPGCYARTILLAKMRGD